MSDHSINSFGHEPFVALYFLEGFFHGSLYITILGICDGRLAVFVYLVFDFALAWTESAWLAFPMALGFLIIIAIIESYVIDWIEKRKNSQED